MKKIVAVSCLSIIGMLSLTSMLSINNARENTDRITTAIEEQPKEVEAEKNETIIYETNNYNTYEQPVKEVVVEREVIVEKEVIKEVEVEKEPEKKASVSEPKYVEKQIEESRDYNDNTNEILKCEVCEKSGTELKVWYDSNNIKHITCKTKCTNGIGALYGN